MPHKGGHWGYKLRKQGQNLAGAGYKKATGHGWRSDKNPVQENLNKKANIANTGSGKKTAGGRIQKKLIEGGWTKTELRHKQEEHKRKQKAKADRKALKKSNPKKYKEMRKKELKIERQKAFSRGSHTWD